MGRKNKNKPKKVNPKRERYAKFKKDKPGALDVRMPDLPEAVMQEARAADDRIGEFWRYRPKVPDREVNERRMRSKR
jgi:hypothetical protein